ncbi:uncharacterized protein LOC112596602 [Melanaphis sacchari]|uniref:uncharacterized protein LOC112596602 n=1 Tax=Melanaphis sacchari TaxID=742174 RepID=UPI000DC134A6|nr:uncharacterized protein LOC112596602 [Melanaphis sacchari]
MPSVNGFTHEDDIILVDLIREHRELYDVKHKKHKDNVFKDRVWNEISIDIGKSVYQCKRRWKNIKAYYLKSKSNMETASSMNNNWPLTTYVSFLDENLCEQNIKANNENGEVQLQLGEQIDVKFLNDNNLALPTSSSAENTTQLKENKIAAILAEGLKERNEILYNSLQKQIEILDNTSFTVTIQYDQNATSNVQSKELKNEHGENVTDETTHDREFALPQLPDSVSCYLAEKLAQSKERNTILHNLQKQIEMLSNKPDTSKSLDLFFKSVLLDVQDFCPRAIDDIKPRILKCVSEVREMYHNSDVPSDNLSCSTGKKCAHFDEGNKILFNLQKQIEILNDKLGVTKTMDLFFKSVSADMEDFCIRAIDDVKIKILECVSEVKDIYSIPDLPSAASSINGNLTPNYEPPNFEPPNFEPPYFEPPNTPPIHFSNILGSPTQGFITYYNVPLYCNDPSNYVNSYY